VPTQRKRLALTKPWQIRCKKHNLLEPKPKKAHIRPRWERVDRATIFFKSTAQREPRLATTRVRRPSKETSGEWSRLRRMRSQRPAVTRVEECTRAETGVGADMAIGNQAEKGKRADLVIDVIKTKKIIVGVSLSK